MTGAGGNTACAACKYQRRKCTPDCPLSPYFPPDQPKRFQNVHKLFGVSNILRILKHVDPSKREDTVKSIAYEADTREKDPVHGCLGVITILQNQVSKLKDELTLVREQLYLVQQEHNFNHQAQMQQIVSSLGGNTCILNVSSAHDTNVIMQHLQQYNEINHPSSDFVKNNSLTTSFEPEQNMTNDNYDFKPASTSRFDVGRYIGGESAEQQSVLIRSGGSVKAKSDQARRGSMHNSNSMTDSSCTFTDTSGDHNMLQDVNHPFDYPGQHAMEFHRRGSGLVNLTVAADGDLRRATGGHNGVPKHDLRSAGVYLSLTNH